MDNAGEPFRPVLVSGKEYDAVAAAPAPLLEEMKRHHAERRRRGDRRARKTASLLQRGSGAGFLGFLHKFTISFRERLQARRPQAVSSSMLALHLLQRWRKSGRDGVVILAGDENRAERLASIVHSLDRSSGVLVFPRLNNLPFDGLEPSREIAGRRSSVLRRLAKAKKPVFLLSTAEAIMERLPLPESLSRLSVVLKVGAKYTEQDLQTRLQTLGYDLDEEAEFPGRALFHGKTFEIFPAGALNPFRIEHAENVIRKIVAVDPEEHEV